MIRRIAVSFALVAGMIYGQVAQPKPKSQKELEAYLANLDVNA